MKTVFRIPPTSCDRPERLVEADGGGRVEDDGDAVRQPRVVLGADTEVWLHEVAGDQLHLLGDVRLLLTHQVEQLSAQNTASNRISFKELFQDESNEHFRKVKSCLLVTENTL